jgi:hypothetical protein
VGETALVIPSPEAIASQYLASMDPSYVGRFSELAKPDVVATLLQGFSAGLKPADCCEAAGIHPQTLVRWQARAAEAPESAYAAFVLALKSARAHGKLALLNRIKEAAEKPQFWTAAAWTLERTDPEQFALRKDSSDQPKVVVQIGAGAGDVQVNVLTVSPQLPAHIGEGALNP